jgi:predicted transcriptional regulator
LIIPCEVAVKSVVPAVKALLATRLVEEHSLKQGQVAEILGISQSAVSRYTRKNRGHVIKAGYVDDIQPLIGKMAESILNEDVQRQGFLAFFCQACAMIRKSGLMCPFCQKTDPKIEIEQCDFCLTYDLPAAER